LARLEDNLRALDVKLAAKQTAILDALTRQRFISLPFLKDAVAIPQGGTSVNGAATQRWMFGPQNKADRY
jgi:hypothetical protein